MKKLSIDELIENLEESIASSSLYVQHHNKTKECASKIYSIRQFIDNLADLAFGRDFRLFKDGTRWRAYPINIVLQSVTHTLCSIVACLQLGNIADTYMLIRKYRDDLFSYLYLLPSYELFNMSDVKGNVKVERDVVAWLRSELKDLQFGSMLKSIVDDVNCKEAAQRFRLKDFSDEINSVLNNYTHSNGIDYYNYLVYEMTEKKFLAQLDNMVEILEKCTCYFVFLLMLKSPFMVLSMDYEDYLDCGMIPPENAGQTCAPFVKTFINEHQAIYGQEMIDYLKLYTSVDFE